MMARNIFDVLFVISLIAPVAVLIVGAFALAIPTARLKRRTLERAEQGRATEPRAAGMRAGGGHAFRGQAVR
jgi:hypothetical protein